MADVNVRIRGEDGVPIIIGHRTVTKDPKIQRKRKFVGFKAGLTNLALRAIDNVLDSFWEPTHEVLEAGESSIVRYAIQVKDEPGTDNPELVVTRLDGRAVPATCAYYELVTKTPEPEKPSVHPPTQPESKAKLVQDRPQRPTNGRNSAPSLLSKFANAIKFPDEPQA